MTQPPNPRRQRHLMDPNAPRQVASAADVARLERVQRWVMSVLVVTTIGHLAVGFVIGALFIDADQVVPRIGLCVIGGVCGALGVAAGVAIHRRSPWTPWLLVGTLPGVVGLFFVLR